MGRLNGASRYHLNEKGGEARRVEKSNEDIVGAALTKKVNDTRRTGKARKMRERKRCYAYL